MLNFLSQKAVLPFISRWTALQIAGSNRTHNQSLFAIRPNNDCRYQGEAVSLAMQEFFKRVYVRRNCSGGTYLISECLDCFQSVTRYVSDDCFVGLDNAG